MPCPSEPRPTTPCSVLTSYAAPVSAPQRRLEPSYPNEQCATARPSTPRQHQSRGLLLLPSEALKVVSACFLHVLNMTGLERTPAPFSLVKSITLLRNSCSPQTYLKLSNHRKPNLIFKDRVASPYFPPSS